MTPAEQKTLKRRSQLIEMKQKGYTDEFIKLAFWANDPTSSPDSELSTLNDLTGANQQNQVQVDGRKFEVKTLADQTAYNKIQADQSQQEQVKVTAREDFTNKLTKLSEISQDTEGIAAAVGPNPLARIDTPFSGAKQRVANKLESILSADTLQKLIDAKAQGATFGALSDSELNLLRASAGVLAQSAIKDSDGKIVGFNMSETDFKKELANLTTTTQKALNSLNTDTAQVGGTQGTNQGTPKVQDPAKVQAWLDANPNDPRAAQVKQLLQSQNQVTQPVAQPSQDITQSSDAIATGGKIGKAVGGFLGGAKIGESIGNALGGFLAKNGDAGKIFQDTLTKLAEMKASGKISEEKYNKLVKSQEDAAKSAFGYDGPSFKQVAGDALQAAMTVGTLAVAAPASAVGKIAAGAATGYGFDVASNLQNKDKSLGQDFTPGLGTVVGATIPVLGVLKNWVAGGGQKGAERIYNSAVKPTLEDTKKAILYNGKTLGRKLLDQGVAGGDAKLLLKSNTAINESESTLQSILSKSKETITRDELAPYLAKIKETLANTPTARAQKAASVVDEALNLLPDTMDLTKANVLKRNLYKELGDLAYKLDPNLSGSAETSKSIASGLKDLIEKKTGNDVVKQLNQKLATSYQLQDGVVTNLARKMRNNLMGVGTIGSLIEKTIGATSVKTYGALVIDQASKILQKSGAGAGGKFTKVMILDAIAQAKKSNQKTKK